ncbi:hypothetical protein SDC9_157892 [bioreactor metagenome]|uniref:Uncharacterized protein n=1 Tax=bioreactor metagenome TaxID=1076179 RepID=A0A645F8P1_9ZZZZ
MKIKIVLSGICLLALLLFVGVEQFTASFQFSAILVLCGFLLLLVSCKAKLAERKNLETSYALVCLLMAGLFASLAPFDGQIRLSTTKELLCVLTGISVSILTGYQLFFAPPNKEDIAFKQKGQQK